MTASAIEFDMLTERIESLQEDWQWWNMVPETSARLLLNPLTDFTVRQRTLEMLEKNFVLETKRLDTWTRCKNVIPTLGKQAPDWLTPLLHRVKPWFSDDKRQKVENAIEKIETMHAEMIQKQQAEIAANAEVEAARFQVITDHPAIVRLAARKAVLWHRQITTPLPANAKPAQREHMERLIAQTDAVRRQVTARRHTPARRAA